MGIRAWTSLESAIREVAMLQRGFMGIFDIETAISSCPAMR
jgi:hypothetical protein